MIAASETITLSGIVTASGNVALTALNSLTSGPDDNIADIVGSVVSLTVTGAGTIVLGTGKLSFLDSSGLGWPGRLSLTGVLVPRTVRFGDNRAALTPATATGVEGPVPANALA